MVMFCLETVQWEGVTVSILTPWSTPRARLRGDPAPHSVTHPSPTPGRGAQNISLVSAQEVSFHGFFFFLSCPSEGFYTQEWQLKSFAELAFNV